MSLVATTPAFKANAHAALEDVNLQSALRGSRGNFIAKRAAAREALPEFDALRDRARDIKNDVLANLDLYLEAYEAKVVESGGVVHWAETAEDARRIVLEICREAGARVVNKGKTMISEECGINDWLAANGIVPVETDLGEYIIQLRGEAPSHIIAPAVHVTVPEVEAAFRKAHTHLAPERSLSRVFRPAARGAGGAAGEVLPGRGGDHRGEHADRRDRAFGDRDQRGQRRSQPVAAAGAYRDGVAGEDRSDVRGRQR